MIRATFLMEQHIGHRTYSQNLRRYVDGDPHLESRWVEITYWEAHKSLERLPLPKGVRSVLRGISQTRQGLASSRDVAFFNTQVPAVFALDMLWRHPFIVASDITPMQYDRFSWEYGHKRDRFAPLRDFKYQVNRAMYRRAAHVVAWSNWVQRSLVRDYDVPPEKISVIPPGVDLEMWQPAETKPLNTPMKILFVGGHFERKGGALLLDAFRRLAPERAELHVVTRDIVPHEPGLRVYHGLKPNSPELRRLYQESDVFVLPTQAEAFGIAAVEAIASGLPVIASHIGGLPDIVVDGETGFLVPAGDSPAFAHALEKLAKSPGLRLTLGRAAREQAEKNFDARINAAKIMDILLDAVNNFST